MALGTSEKNFVTEKLKYEKVFPIDKSAAFSALKSIRKKYKDSTDVQEYLHKNGHFLDLELTGLVLYLPKSLSKTLAYLKETYQVNPEKEENSSQKIETIDRLMSLIREDEDNYESSYNQIDKKNEQLNQMPDEQALLKKMLKYDGKEMACPLFLFQDSHHRKPTFDLFSKEPQDMAPVEMADTKTECKEEFEKLQKRINNLQRSLDLRSRQGHFSGIEVSTALENSTKEYIKELSPKCQQVYHSVGIGPLYPGAASTNPATTAPAAKPGSK